MDPLTLETRGEWSHLDSLSAHPRFDPDQNMWINFGVSDPNPVTGTSTVHLYEMDATTATIQSPPTSLILPGVALMHDCVLTKNYILLSWNLCNLDAKGGIKALLGVGPIAGALQLDPSGKHVFLCIPRSILEEDSADKPIDALKDPRIKRIEAPFSFAFHYGNAYEDEKGQIVLDRVETDDRTFDFGLSMLKPEIGPLWETIPWNDIKAVQVGSVLS